MPQEIKFWAHQTAAIEAAKNVDHYCLFMEMGCGKSATLCRIIVDKIEQNKQMLSTLIVAPSIILEQWKREFATYSDIPQELIYCLRGSQKQRIQTVVGATRNGRRIIAVCNYESLIMPGLVTAIEDHLKPSIVVCDESQRIKSMTAKRTKVAIRIGDAARFRYLLTGTPVTNGVEGIFSQFRFLDGGETFGKNFFEFRRKYFYDKNAHMPRQNYFPDFVIKTGAIAEINSLIYRKAIRVKKSECLTLPPFVK